ncbi:hypothetical protein M3Y99_01337500 [Aphelenchoides fujianensis]|nr:hypothetical protein M3Y99_01337500 [Aphelenchoides fujianensis]
MAAKFQQGPWMDTTRILIEEVRKHRCLYDKSDRRYKDHRSKPPIWAAIAQKTRYRKGRDALNKWNYLRKHYATLLRRIHEAQEEEGGKVDESAVHIAWDHFERMSFLRPFIKTFPLEDSSGFQDEDEAGGTPQPDSYQPPPRGALFEDDDDDGKLSIELSITNDRSFSVRTKDEKPPALSASKESAWPFERTSRGSAEGGTSITGDVGTGTTKTCDSKTESVCVTSKPPPVAPVAAVKSPRSKEEKA